MRAGRQNVTSALPEESLDEVLEFASGWSCERDGLSHHLTSLRQRVASIT
jgi:hypothetical protein